MPETVTPAAATETAVAETPKPDVAAEREAALTAREQAIVAREKKFQDELKKNATEKTGLGAKLSRLNELEQSHAENEKQKQLAKLNPKEYLRGIFGDDYFKIITDTEVNGVPPAQLVAAEIQKVREEFKQVLEKQKEQARADATASEQRELEESRATVSRNCTSFYEKSAADYPVFKKLGNVSQVGSMLGQRIEREFMQSGRMMTEKEAADGLENELLSLLEEAVTADKYKPRLQEKLKPATVSTSSGSQGVPSSTRRTLSNNLTGSTPGKAPPRTEAERLQRANEVFEAARRKS